MFEGGYPENNGYDMNRIAACVAVVVAIVMLIVAGFSLVGKYNNLVDLQEDVELANANVQEKMQRRLELIPDLVEVVKSAAKHEEKVFGDIANARAALAQCLKEGATADKLSEADNELTKQINSLIQFVKEDYPELTVGVQYTNLMDQLEGCVSRISIERDKYNQTVSEYNRAIKKFPGSIYAKIFGFEEIEPFVAYEEANNTSMVDFG